MPTPNTAPTAMWVELTGSPSAEAPITVIAAASATLNARVGFIRVICSPTVRTSLAPNSTRPMEMPAAPTSITDSGISAFAVMPPVVTALKIAASGPTALATSLAPWANDNSAAAQISGMVNRLRTDLLRFSIPAAARWMIGRSAA